MEIGLTYIKLTIYTSYIQSISSSPTSLNRALSVLTTFPLGTTAGQTPVIYLEVVIGA